MDHIVEHLRFVCCKSKAQPTVAAPTVCVEGGVHGQAGVGPKLTSCHRCRKINLAVSACSAGFVWENWERCERQTVTSSLARVEAAASSRSGVCRSSVVGACGCCQCSGRCAVAGCGLRAGSGLAIFWRRQCGWWHANSEELLLKVESGGEAQRPTAGPKPGSVL